MRSAPTLEEALGELLNFETQSEEAEGPEKRFAEIKSTAKASSEEAKTEEDEALHGQEAEPAQRKPDEHIPNDLDADAEKQIKNNRSWITRSRPQTNQATG